MAKSTTSSKILLPEVRLAFVNVHKARAFSTGGDARYSLECLLDPKSDKHAKVIKEIKEAGKFIYDQTWGDDKVKLLSKCFGTSEELNKDYEGYEGMFVVRLSNSRRPVVVDRDGRTPLAEEDGRPYSGCIGNVTCTLWTQDNQFGKRINGNLRGVQFVREGDQFGGVNPEGEFDSLEDERDTEDVKDEYPF